MKQTISEKALETARRSISEIAVREGKTEAEIREGIEEAIRFGMADPDPKVQAAWRRIPSRGRTPTPEEVVAWGAHLVASGRMP